MKYTHFTTEDFLKDEYFKHWALQPDHDSDLFWQAFIAHHPAKSIEIAEAKALLQSLRFSRHIHHPPSDQEKEAVYSNILTKSQAVAPDIKRYRPAPQPGVWLRVASVIFLALLTSVVWKYVSDYSGTASPTDIEPAISYKSTDMGQKMTLRLSDGSMVKLNAGSSLKYPDAFGESREVYLTGEAFFEIAENPDKPFTVHAEGLRTVVLGTSFNVRVRSDLPAEVAVLTGKVAVLPVAAQADVQEIALLPNQMVSIDNQTGHATKKELDYDAVFSWKDDVLYFKDASLQEVLSTLQNWYGVEFTVNKDFGPDNDFSGQYDNKPLDAVLSGIGFTFGFNYTIEGKHITIN
jgi:ferric-dicitrate binding protein FerR (iron transport regulator)